MSLDLAHIKGYYLYNISIYWINCPNSLLDAVKYMRIYLDYFGDLTVT